MNNNIDYNHGGFRFESRQVESMCAGFSDQSAPSAFGQDSISIQGITHEGASKNPRFVAVLEERVISSLIL